MAKKYKKMNYAKTLTRTGSTFAVAMAVTMALSNQAQAAELPEAPEADLPVTPLEELNTTGSAASIAVDPSEVSEVNTEISQSNTETAEENSNTAENNEILDGYNESAIENNNTDTEGELPTTILPELPDAPEAPVIPNTDELEGEAHNEAVDGYNEKLDGYNEEVDGYNEKVDGYNEIVDGYNDAADIRDIETQEQYQKELDAYNEYLENQQIHDESYQAYLEEIARLEAEHKAAQDQAEAEHNAAQDQAEAEHEAARAEAEAAHKAAEEKAKAEHEAAEKAAYEAAKAEAEAAHQAAEEKAKAEHEAAQDQAEAEYEAAQDQAEAEYEAAQDQLEAEHEAARAEAEAAYEEDKKTYDEAVATEEKIYDDVTEYNNGILEDNEDIDDLNEALEDALDSKAVENIDEVSGLNANVEVDADILETLNTHDELAAAQQALLERGAALDADTRKDAELGSDDYASYLEDVKQFNADVEAHNANVTAYNEAVTAYNEAVDIYNQNAETTTSTGSSATGVADWGNIEINKNTTFGHIDVKYTAATAKDKTVEVDEDGNETVSYSDSVTSHTVVGVYTSEAAAKKNSNSYGVTYTNDDNSTAKTQGLQKESSEFRTTSHNSAALDPEEGQISFYMTLKNNETNELQSISVNLDDTTVYPEGTYYNGKNMNNLGYFRDSNGNSLPKVTINGTTYYDISGQSVFVVSAMTCDGLRVSGGSNWWGSSSTYTMDPDGLDLVLNVQTLIEISQANKANKINYASYELGKTAQAIKVEHKTYEEINGEFEYPEFERTTYERTKYERTKYEGTEFEYPDFVPTEYEGPEFEYPDFVPTEYEGPEFEYPDFERTEFEREDFTAPEYDGPGVPDEVTPPDDVLLETQRLERVEKLNKLDKLMRNSWTPPTDPGSTPGTTDPEPVVVDVEEPVVTIVDEPVPLAKAPKTGDVSGLWALLSGLSLGGMGLLNRKRKDEE